MELEKKEKVGRLRLRRRRSEISSHNMPIPSSTPQQDVVIQQQSSSNAKESLRMELSQHHSDDDEGKEEVESRGALEESLSSTDLLSMMKQHFNHNERAGAGEADQVVEIPLSVTASEIKTSSRIIMNRLPGSNLNYNVQTETIAEDPDNEELESYSNHVRGSESHSPSTSKQSQNQHNQIDLNNNDEDSDDEIFRKQILERISQIHNSTKTEIDDDDDDDDEEAGRWKKVLVEFKKESEKSRCEFGQYVESLYLSYHDVIKNMEDEFDNKMNDLTKENQNLKLNLDNTLEHNSQLQKEIQDLKIEISRNNKDLEDKSKAIEILEGEYKERDIVEGGDCQNKSFDALKSKVEELEHREKLLIEELESKAKGISGTLHNDDSSQEQLETTVTDLQFEKMSREQMFKDENKHLKIKYQEAKAILIAQEKFVQEIEEWAKGKEVESYMGIENFRASVQSIIIEANETMNMVSEKIDKLSEERTMLFEKARSSEIQMIKCRKDIDSFKNIISNFEFRLKTTMLFPVDNILMDEDECDQSKSNSEDNLNKKSEKQLESIFKRIAFWKNEVERQKSQDDKRILELESNLMNQKKINLEEVDLYKIKFKAYSRLMLKMRSLIINMKKSIHKYREERETLKMKQVNSDEIDDSMKEKHQKFTMVIENVSNILEREQISSDEILDRFNL